MMTPLRSFILGSLGFDYIMNFSGRFADRIMPDKLHAISLSFLVDSLKKQFGGTAGNIAYSLQLLGMTPTVVAPIGNDGDSYLEFFTHAGMSTEQIQKFEDAATSSYFVMTDQDDNQIGSFYLGATAHAKELSIPSSATEQDFVMLAPTEPEAMKKYVRECKNRQLRYMYDPAFQIGTFSSDELLEGINGAEILIGNDYEIALIEKKTGLSHKALLEKVKILITTLGGKGSIIESHDERVEIGVAKPIELLDPTGAGDAWRGGFLAGYLRGFDLKTCGQMGATAAVYTVEKYGTITHTYTVDAFCKRYAENFQQELKFIV